MTPPMLQLEDLQFSRQNLFDAIRKACGVADSWRPNQQALYLADFFSQEACRAGTIFVERPYVDRHYLDEYSRYYATALHAPSPHATRLHFLGEQLGRRELLTLLSSASAGDEPHRAVTERNVGVARFHCGEDAFLDAVFDTTDVLRAEPCYSRLLAMVALTASYRQSVRDFVTNEVPHAIGF